MKLIPVFLLALLCVPMLAACSGSDKAATTDSAASLSLCGDCGELKGGDTCCAEGAAKCDS